MWPGRSDVLEQNFIVLERIGFFLLKSPPSLPWVMFFKVHSLSRSKQERMPGLACEERQVNKTAGQLMRSSFAAIDLCGHFWLGDKKSVCGRCLLICSGSPSAWSMLHSGREVLPWGVYLFILRENTHTIMELNFTGWACQIAWTRRNLGNLDQIYWSVPGIRLKSICTFRNI